MRFKTLALKKEAGNRWHMAKVFVVVIRNITTNQWEIHETKEPVLRPEFITMPKVALFYKKEAWFIERLTKECELVTVEVEVVKA